MSKELQASQLAWKKLRKILLRTALLAGLGTVAVYALSGGSVLLRADGMVTSQRVEVAAPWQDSRIREVYVRPGDWVEAGQKVAVVESAAISRSLADLAAEKARLISQKAQLNARKVAVSTLLPLAEVNANQAQSFLAKLQNASAKGLMLSRALQEMSAASMQASERFLSLQAEQASFAAEAEAEDAALEQVSTAYDDLQHIYGDGVLRAPAAGYVGGKVGMVGEVLSAGNDKIASIYTGRTFVLAYIPEGYLFDVAEGQKVAIKARGQSVPGYIEKVLPVTESLPPEFQAPTKALGRGLAVRIAFSDKSDLSIDEKIRVTRCYLENCKLDLAQMIIASIRELGRLNTEISEIGSYSAQAQVAGGAE
jgi:multidrug resistance efflux pump